MPRPIFLPIAVAPILFVWAAACQPSPGGGAPDTGAAAADAGADAAAVTWTPHIGEPAQIVPSAGMPPQIVIQPANNNLDVAMHDGRLFLAFRTAPYHFADPAVELHVVSSGDGVSFDHEATFATGADLREPRLLSWNGQLVLFMALLGEDAFDFEPRGVRLARYEGPGQWSEPIDFYLPGLVVWRARVIEGVPHVLGYVGGEGIYASGGPPIEVHWLTSSVGGDWRPVVPGQPVVLTGGVSETDLTFLDDGSLVAVARNEKGDDRGFGSLVCRAPADEPGAWTCASDPRKYDSPYIFRHEGDVYLFARRNVTETGDYDLGHAGGAPADRYLDYQLDYWAQPKRCALWKVAPEALAVTWLLDLPSRGDTCFVGVIPTGAHTFDVYNYSNDLDGPDLVWNEGQMEPTNIYRVELRFEPQGYRR